MCLVRWTCCRVRFRVHVCLSDRWTGRAGPFVRLGFLCLEDQENWTSRWLLRARTAVPRIPRRLASHRGSLPTGALPRFRHAVVRVDRARRVQLSSTFLRKGTRFHQLYRFCSYICWDLIGGRFRLGSYRLGGYRHEQWLHDVRLQDANSISETTGRTLTDVPTLHSYGL